MNDSKPFEPKARGNNSLSAYYYSFDKTGVDAIDNILSAVAAAGKQYHHTEDWHSCPQGQSESCVEAIQRMANEAAAVMREERPRMHDDKPYQGSGWPYDFRCWRCRKPRASNGCASYRGGQVLHCSHKQVRTGRKKKYKGKNSQGERGLTMLHEYRCECGYTGFSRHEGVLEIPVEER